MKYCFSFVILLLFTLSTAFAQSDANEYVLNGKITAHSGKEMRIAYESGPFPQPGDYGMLSKHFVQEIFGTQAQGWLEIAKVQFVKGDDNGFSLAIIEEKSEILVNGEPVDHFKVGNIVRMKWGEAKSDFSEEE